MVDDINRLALVRLRNSHTQPLAPAAGPVVQSSVQRPIVEETLDSEGDGAPIPQATPSEIPNPRSSRIQRVPTVVTSYSVRVVNADTGEELETLTFDNREEYDQWVSSSNNMQIRILSTIKEQSQGAKPLVASTSEQQPYTGTTMPEPPTTEAEAAAYRQQLSSNNLFYGEGGLEAYPVDERYGSGANVLDNLENAKESVLSDKGKFPGLQSDQNLTPGAPLPSAEPPTEDSTAELNSKAAALADLKLPTSLDLNSLGLGSVASKVNDVSAPAEKAGTTPAKTTTTEKANIDRTGMLSSELERAEHPSNSGLLDRPCPEPVPEFKKCSSDQVINGKNNTWIILGRDRPAGFSTGYGPGLGHTQAGAIDIVVGRMAPFPKSYDREGNSVKASPIFGYAINDDGKQVCDAARIYISQKTDVDSNFSLADGVVGNMKTRSAIAMKSDAIRIIARDAGIKLVTHHPQLPNSQGGTSSRNARGIDLIAGNDDSNLQPMILGNNLVEMLREMSDALDKTIGTLSSVILNLAEVDMALATHIHPQSFPPGAPNLPSPVSLPVCIASLTKLISLDAFSTFAEKWQLETISKTYLDAGGELSIRSSYNNLN